MSAGDYQSLNPEKALIWRIVHCDNLWWILDNGLHCGNCKVRSDRWVNIGNTELISKRAMHPVPLAPGGTLNDYVPFYFTPFSVMLKNIHSGWAGIQKRSNEEIIFLVSSLHQIHSAGLPFLFTDSHAYSTLTTFYNSLNDLNKIDWPLLQRRDFRRDPDDPWKLDRYQAEALVYQTCPVSSLLGVICYNEQMKERIDREVSARGLNLKVYVRPGWYFQ
ncbi:MAG TPA: DUF4433 domain-containing protein [Candidatus Thiothrix moscowensis]|uniref:type II toxin-antitoxin system toxin DNA ADP-ribosyl transferase DarT n=1 Tax=unclassified Thiothrix TaxID=2636184 RepID=UPI0025FE1A83|nr:MULTISPECIES: DUF4433 domain-containing protein [unclassified Thiothrix]HRJ52696.1 DUF4433 domain-containing protein [Candidatus Thiothrix moscowensis]HRJ92820.1 DUF4433 domain-containing protein [Candidatus Thiothrix moscowensis]